MTMRIIEGAPAAEPLLLPEVKEHLRLDGTSEDTKVGALLETARTIIERTFDLSLIDRAITIYLHDWVSGSPRVGGCKSNIGQNTIPGHSVSGGRLLKLSRRPISQINTIHYVGGDGQQQLWPASAYMLEPGLEPALHLVGGASWPTVKRGPGAIEIDATAGFGPNWNAVPSDIRQALMLLTTFLYMHRGDQAATAVDALRASGAAALLSPYQRKRL